MNEDLVAEIRSNSKTGPSSGGKKFISKLEKLTGRDLTAKKPGRPKRRNGTVAIPLFCCPHYFLSYHEKVKELEVPVGTVFIAGASK
jgi:hypothetical protein